MFDWLSDIYGCLEGTHPQVELVLLGLVLVVLGIIVTTLPETNSSPLKIGRAPKGNDRIPTIHFQVRKCSFQGGVISGNTGSTYYYHPQPAGGEMILPLGGG